MVNNGKAYFHYFENKVLGFSIFIVSGLKKIITNGRLKFY